MFSFLQKNATQFNDIELIQQFLGEEEKEIQAKIYEYIEECIKEDSKNSKTKYLFTKITGAKTMLINYLKLLNIHENSKINNHNS